MTKYQYSEQQQYNTPLLTVNQQGKHQCVCVHFILLQAQRAHLPETAKERDRQWEDEVKESKLTFLHLIIISS